jgi:hypothetical protein
MVYLYRHEQFYSLHSKKGEHTIKLSAFSDVLHRFVSDLYITYWMKKGYAVTIIKLI